MLQVLETVEDRMQSTGTPQGGWFVRAISVERVRMRPDVKTVGAASSQWGV